MPLPNLLPTPKIIRKISDGEKTTVSNLRLESFSHLQLISVKSWHLSAGILNCVRSISFQRAK